MEDNVYHSLESANDRYVSRFIGAFSILSFLSSILLSIGLMIREKHFFSFIAFFSSTVLYHIFRSIKSVFPKFIVEAGFSQRLIMSHDIHMVVFSLFMFVSERLPLLYVINYILLTGCDALMFASFVTPPSLRSVIDPVKQVFTHPFSLYFSAILEIFIGFIFMIKVFTRHSFYSLITFILYFAFNIVYGYACNDYHSRIWSKIGMFIQETASKNHNTFGPILELVIERVSRIGSFANKVFPKKEFKVHFQ